MESEEQLLIRHKKEQRDLVGQQTSIRKQATKSTRKRINKQIQELEDALKAKQLAELKAIRGEEDGNGEEEEEELTPAQLLAQMEIKEQEQQQEPTASNEGTTKKKRNRQKERLAKRQAEFDAITQGAQDEAANQIDYRQIELDTLERQCGELKLKQIDIKSDGHCLFNSISDQLKVRQDIEIDYLGLRREAGEYIQKHSDDFIPFLIDETSGESRDLDEYVKKIINTAMWGSDMEILALSKIYNCPISIMQSGQKSLIINPEGVEPELKLVYYKHIFGLGEHYGSLQEDE